MDDFSIKEKNVPYFVSFIFNSSHYFENNPQFVFWQRILFSTRSIVLLAELLLKVKKIEGGGGNVITPVIIICAPCTFYNLRI